MATEEPLLPGQSPATPQEDNLSQYGALVLDKDAKEELSLVVSYANGVSDQDTQAKMISNIAPILLTLAVALKTIMESKHDKAMQKLKKENLVSDYKRAMWEISRFEGDGASKKMEESDDGGAEETKEDPEEPTSPIP